MMTTSNHTPNAGKQQYEPVLRLAGWMALSSLLMAATGCDQVHALVENVNDPDIREAGCVASYTAPMPKEVDVSHVKNAATEGNALKMYFKGKQFLKMARQAKTEAAARQYGAEAEHCFEQSLRFFSPDLEAMKAGKSPVHASANWEFLRGLHRVWSDSIALTGRRSPTKSQIDDEAKDAWALSAISRMTQNVENGDTRLSRIARTFPEVREGLEESDNYNRQLSAGRKYSRTSPSAVADDLSKARAAKPFEAMSSLFMAAEAKAPVADSGKAASSTKSKQPQAGSEDERNRMAEPSCQ